MLEAEIFMEFVYRVYTDTCGLDMFHKEQLALFAGWYCTVLYVERFLVEIGYPCWSAVQRDDIYLN